MSSAVESRSSGDATSVWLDVRHSVLLAVSRILGGIAIGHFVATTFPFGRWALHGGTWFGGFNQWDSGWYLTIAHAGYANPRATCFFPGYPFAIRVVRTISFDSISYLGCGLIVAWSAFILAVVLVQTLANQMLPRGTARFATVLFAWSPASIFFVAAYSESLFVAASALTLLLIQRNRLWGAAVVAGFATATSPLGIAVACAVGIAVARRWRTARRSLAEFVAMSLVAVSGLLVYMGWLWGRFRDPFKFVHEEATFNRVNSFPFSGLFVALFHLGQNVPSPGVPKGNWSTTRLINLGFNSLALIIVVYLVTSLVVPRIRRFPIPFTLYGIVGFLLPSMSNQMFHGIPNPEAGTRLTANNLSLYSSIALLLSRRRELMTPFLCLWVALAVFIQAVFSNGYYFT